MPPRLILPWSASVLKPMNWSYGWGGSRSWFQVGDDYAIRDGHHRVSVAKALGAPTIRAVVA